MTEPVYYTWERIEQHVDLYKSKIAEAIKLGVSFYPHALLFLRFDRDQNCVAINVMDVTIGTRQQLEEFVERIVNARVLGPAQIEAAGFVAFLAGGLAHQLLGEAVSADAPVPVLHVEHLFHGVRTWVLSTPRGEDPMWTKAKDSLVSQLPPCLSTEVYGYEQGQA
jgi:hypothetical protein